MQDILIKNIGKRKIVFWGYGIYQDNKNYMTQLW